MPEGAPLQFPPPENCLLFSGRYTIVIPGLHTGLKGSDMPQNEENGNPEQSRGLLNVLKLLFLAAVLVCAWFLLDWLINGK